LREPEHPDPDHLPDEQVARPHHGEHQLDDAVALFLDHAGEHPLPIDGDGPEQQRGGKHRDQRVGVVGCLVRMHERRRRELGRRRQMIAQCTHRRIRGGGELRVDGGPEDDPIATEQ
jgi:hypothetical protein